MDRETLPLVLALPARVLNPSFVMPDDWRPIRSTLWLRARPIFLTALAAKRGSGNRWGDYSALTIDPVDDTTFWYTNEYYSTTTSL